MKVILTVLAIAVAVSANPINRKWEEIRDLVQEIGGDVDDAVAEIKIATGCEACNPQIVQQIKASLDRGVVKVFFVFEKIHAQIGHQTLTYQQAKEYFSKLETILNKVKDDLRNPVSQLPQGVQIRIKNILDNKTDAILEKQEKILTLLNLKQVTASVNTDWEEISYLVEEIGAEIYDAVDEIQIATYGEGNPEIGQQIEAYLERGVAEALLVFEKIHVQIDHQTLTYQQAKEYFSQLETILNKVKDDLRNPVSQLPQGVQIKVKSIFDSYTDAILQKQEKILVLLNLKQVTTSVSKWNEISELFLGIKYTVGFSLSGVVLISQEANQEVGQQVYDYIEGKAPEFAGLLAKIDDEIDAQTLTYNLAVTYFNQLETVLNKVHDDLTNLVFELPQGAQLQIQKILETSTTQIKYHVDEILKRLTTN